MRETSDTPARHITLDALDEPYMGPVGKHGPYGTHTNLDGSPVPPASAPAATAGLCCSLYRGVQCSKPADHRGDCAFGVRDHRPAATAEPEIDAIMAQWEGRPLNDEEANAVRNLIRRMVRSRLTAPSGEEADTPSVDEDAEDATNLAGLITMCHDLKQRLVPFGASEAGWDSAIATLERAAAQATELAALRDLLADALRFADIAALRAANFGDEDSEAIILGDRLRAALAPRQTTGDEHG